MLEESTKTFYDVDTVTPSLGNPASWAITGLSPSILGANRLAFVVPNRLNAEWGATLVKQGPRQTVDHTTRTSKLPGWSPSPGELPR